MLFYPQFESVTLLYLNKRADRYARVRVWGSIGFIVTVLLGVAVDNNGAGGGAACAVFDISGNLGFQPADPRSQTETSAAP